MLTCLKRASREDPVLLPCVGEEEQLEGRKVCIYVKLLSLSSTLLVALFKGCYGTQECWGTLAENHWPVEWILWILKSAGVTFAAATHTPLLRSQRKKKMSLFEVTAVTVGSHCRCLGFSWARCRCWLLFQFPFSGFIDHDLFWDKDNEVESWKAGEEPVFLK